MSLTRDKLTREINASEGTSEEDKQSLREYLAVCTCSSQWGAFAHVRWVNTGPRAMIDYRREWFPSPTLTKITAIVSRHTARPDVDALVKALENLCRETEISGDSDSGAYWSAKDALARHAKGGATG